MRRFAFMVSHKNLFGGFNMIFILNSVPNSTLLTPSICATPLSLCSLLREHTKYAWIASSGSRLFGVTGENHPNFHVEPTLTVTHRGKSQHIPLDYSNGSADSLATRFYTFTFNLAL